MISLKALFDTIERFEKNNEFKANTIYLNDSDFIMIPKKIGYNIYVNDHYAQGTALFVGFWRNKSVDILTNEELIIRDIIQ